MALKLNGNDDRLHAKDFRTFARTARLKAGDADAPIEAMLEKVGQVVERILLPALADYGQNGKEMAEQMLDIVRARLKSFA